MKRKPKSVGKYDIVGFGDLTFDHIFESVGDDLIYVDSRGGGSIFNILVNFSQLGGSAAAGGVGGQDVFGLSAKAELDELLVDVSHISLLPRRTTLVIFEVIRSDHTGLWRSSRSSFSMTCPVCSIRISDTSVARMDGPAFSAADNAPNGRIICFDRFTKKRIQAAREYRSKGITTVLDLGKSDFIRYRPAAQVLADLDAFDIVVIPDRLARSLTTRAGFDDVRNLCGINPYQLFFISKGEHGMSLYDNRQPQKLKHADFNAPSVDSLIDEAGAGDAFLARLLWELSSMKLSNPLKDLRFDALVSITSNSIDSLGTVLESVGARGHLLRPRRSASSIPDEWQGMSVHEIRSHLTPSEKCPFCLGRDVKSKITGKKMHIGALVNLRTLEKRMLFAIERKDAVQKCTQLLKAKGTAYTIGSGGSYTAAMFLSLLLNTNGGIFAQPIRPFDYIKTGRRSDFVITLSYSGSTADCADAITRARQLEVSQIVLVTGAAEPELINLLDLESGRDVVISSANEAINKLPKERGFVSIAGTIIPCALWTAAVAGPSKMTHLVRQLNTEERMPLDPEMVNYLKEALKSGQTIPVFGGGFSWPAMLDLESKFTEAHLGNLQLHEVKDFSHGRFMSVISNASIANLVIFLHVGRWYTYEKTLIKILSKNRPLIVLDREDDSIMGALRLLIDVQHFAQECASLIGKDISRPGNIPSQGLRLYKWSKGLYK